MKKLLVFMVLLTVLLGGMAFAERYERSETIYCGGGLWGPPANWNPAQPWAAVSGTIGLIYETLFTYDPLTDALTPWLAESGSWIDDDTYRVVLRDGIEWSDGTPMTSEDVKFTFELPAYFDGVHYTSLWEQFESVVAVDELTVEFNFRNPRYHEWAYQIYQLPVLPKHLWENLSVDAVLTGSNEGNVIGSGPYLFETYDLDRMIYLKNENWWAQDLLGLEVVPKRVVYARFASNNVVLGMMMKGEELDVSNFFLPGIPAIKGPYAIHTWYEDEPYMLSDNTAFLFVNTQKKPMDDPTLRRAMAFAINSNEICKRVFENMVIPSNPLGFLPIDGWMKYYSQEAVDANGFVYDPSMAKKMLDEAGYKDVNKDGFREAPDGTPFKMEIVVPFGWTDWMESIKIIAVNLQAVGLNAEAKFPDYNKYFEQISTGNYDLAINNFNSKLSVTPWTLYNWLFADIINDRANSGNFERYTNPEMLDLVDAFNEVPMADVEAGKAIMADVAEIFLRDMPAIPLWYNGMWFQANTNVWSNWPGENSDNQSYPTTWGGTWQLGGVMMLTKIQPK
ncbi:MAG TPA: ABC transporter substrate-binding protein [Thermotogota bacterium]|nr:ABC transporter substrate-binding protein [Thermotogota bacterium]HRW93631.1 ABC transporter substrate-binding protein [Thermotogota bacterium]